MSLYYIVDRAQFCRELSYNGMWIVCSPYVIATNLESPCSRYQSEVPANDGRATGYITRKLREATKRDEAAKKSAILYFTHARAARKKRNEERVYIYTFPGGY